MTPELPDPTAELEEIYAGLPPAILDEPDEHDYLMSELGGASDTDKLPIESSQIFIEILNQGRGNKCSIYGSVGLMNNQNAREATQIGIDHILDSPENYVAEATKRGFKPQWGWFVRNACQMLKDLGKIEGFVRLETKEDMMRAIHIHGGFIASSMAIDWRESNRLSKLVRGAGGGHIFYFNGYNQDGIWLANSWGRAWGVSGRLFVPWADIDVLNPSKFAFLDKSNEVELYSLKAIKKGLTTQPFDKFRPLDTCTRAEAAIFISRAKLIDQSVIWSATKQNDPVTEYELETMMKRAGYPIEQPKGDDKVKRWEVIEKLIA